MEPDATIAPEPRRFSLEVDDGADVVSVTAHGEIDLDTSDQFGHALAATTARHVDVDLADVSYMDSAGLRALLTARADAEQRGAQLRVVEASTIVRRLFEIAGVADLLDDGT